MSSSTGRKGKKLRGLASIATVVSRYDPTDHTATVCGRFRFARNAKTGMCYERRGIMRSLVFLLALTGAVGVAHVSGRATPPQSAAEEDGPLHVPFKPGESLTYAAKVNFM